VAALSGTVLIALAAVAACLAVLVAVKGFIDHRADPILAFALLFVVFYSLSPRGGMQYLVWGLPFFVLTLRSLVLPYTAAATGLLYGFYSLHNFSAIPPALVLPAIPAGYLYVAGVLAVMAVSWPMLVRVLAGTARSEAFIPTSRERTEPPASTAAEAS
jgi:hypothetical protein